MKKESKENGYEYSLVLEKKREDVTLCKRKKKNYEKKKKYNIRATTLKVSSKVERKQGKENKRVGC